MRSVYILRRRRFGTCTPPQLVRDVAPADILRMVFGQLLSIDGLNPEVPIPFIAAWSLRPREGIAPCVFLLPRAKLVHNPSGLDWVEWR